VQKSSEYVETCKLRVGKIAVECVTVVKFRVNDGFEVSLS